ncbi:MAG: DUF4931 domain-containing protein [Syntrophomonadaceae bacterium]
MAEIRRDLLKNNWVAIAPESALKPHDFPIKRRGIDAVGNKVFCPFCEGHEASTPPEIMAIREDGSAPDSPGWSIRVVPNKFAVFKLEGVLEMHQTGIYQNLSGLGRQEVVIETPRHGTDIHDFDSAKLAQIFRVWRQRYEHLSVDKRIKYIQIYKNRGIFAGASQEHSHSQVMGLPFVPRCNTGIIDYFQKNGCCLLCAIIDAERQSGARVVHETGQFLLVCPYASRFSYETWIIPKRHAEHYGDITDDEIADLAMICRSYLGMMMDVLQDPAYNVVINTAPVNTAYQPGYHWFLEMIPRLLVTTGVDVATGIYTNPVAPELAAELFRQQIPNYL